VLPTPRAALTKTIQDWSLNSMAIKYRTFPEVSEQDAARFWGQVAVTRPDACWAWQGRTNPRRGNYGEFQLRFYRYRSHRTAYFLHYGVDPLENAVCHKCDNPLCCNPAHLWLGTRADNSADMKAKGRQSKGEHRKLAKLTNEKAKAIFIAYHRREASSYQLAAKYGVSSSVILSIARGKTWRDATAGLSFNRQRV
jgi:hypothetical protein